MSRSWALPVAGAALLGIVGALAYPPFTWPIMMLLSLGGFLGLVWQTRAASWRVTFAVGFSYGLGFMAVLIWWMNAVSEGAYIALVLAQAVMYSFAAPALRAVMGSRWWPLLGACVWVGFEQLRGTQPMSGFPWGRLVHITADTPVDAWTRWVGPATTSALIFLMVALFVAAIHDFAARRLAVAVAVAAVVVAGGITLPVGHAGPSRIAEVAIVQGDVPGAFGTWRQGEIFRLHLDKTRELADEVADGSRPRPAFVIWPENAMDLDPGSLPEVGEALTALERAVGAPILVGGILDGPSDTTAYNASLVWADGAEQARYVKRNLVPYGEYVPFRQLLGNVVPRIDREIPRDMLPGDQVGTMSIGGVTVGTAICWDIAYDTAIRDNVIEGAELLVVQTSNASFTGTAQPEQQWLISLLRAVETGRDLAVASTNGISGIVDASGRTVARSPVETSDVISARVQLAEGITPGVRFGPWLMWIMTAAGILAIVFLRVRETAGDRAAKRSVSTST